MSDELTPTPIVEVKNVSFAYYTQQVLRDVSLTVTKGEYLGIIGPNGGGKTTLLKIILGLLKPTSGSVTLFGEDSRVVCKRCRIGYIAQKAIRVAQTFPATVSEVVTMGRYARLGFFRNPGSHDRQHIHKAIEAVDIEKYRNVRIGDLSTGLQQRVFIARALAAEPDILFLDEPTVGVDLETQEEFYTLLKKLNRDLQITLVMVSHDIDVIANEVTTVACINQKLIYCGKPREFLRGDYLEKLYGKGVRHILHGH